MRFKAVIFDYDGTLVDSLKAFTTAISAAIKSLGLPRIEEARLAEIVKLPFEESLTIIVPLNLPNRVEVIDKFIEEYRRAYGEVHLKYVKPMPGVPSMLRGLRERGLSIGVLTGRKFLADYVGRELAFLNLDKLVQVVVTFRDARAARSKVDLILKCAELLSVRPNECAVVGDSPQDIEAGREAGALTVGALYGFYDEGEIVNKAPDFLIKSPLEIMEILE